MGSQGARIIRFAFLAVVAAAFAGVFVVGAGATAFDDATPCPVTLDNGQPLLVCPGGTVGTPYSIRLEGRGCPPFKYTVLSGALPAGLSLASNGVLSGTPTTSGVSRFYVQLYENCAFVKTAEREFTISIDSALRIVTNSIPQTASVGVPYTTTLQAAIVTSPSSATPVPPETLQWSVVGGALPPGLNVANGVISGTPTTEGSFQFQVQAAIDSNRKHFQTFSLTVRQPLTATGAKPLATPPLPTVWETGLPFAAKITPSGGSGTYTVSLTSGTLPTGLVLGPDGTISGTPTTPGVFRASVGLADSEGRSAEYVANFAVAQRLAVTTVALKPGKVGKLYRAKVVSSGGVNPRLWKLVGGKLPKGLKFDRKLGLVSGIPKKAGSPRVTFQVTDGLRVIAKKTLRIVIAPTPKR